MKTEPLPAGNGTHADADAPRRSWIRSAAINLLMLGAGLAVSLLLLELFLRIYNPFQARIKGNRIVLLTNKQYHFRNHTIPTLDPVINVSRNALGFRGPNPPQNFGDYFTIFTVGGSTTQCFYLSDDKTWTARLGKLLDGSFRNVWINNAGLDGHSTFGHQVLVEDIIRPLHPKVVLLLVGTNDVGREPNFEFDAENVTGSISFHSPAAFMKTLSAYSEVAALLVNLDRSLNAYRHGLLHRYVDVRKLSYFDASPDVERRFVERHTTGPSASYLTGFRDRLLRIIEIARSGNIEPVLITQPLLVSPGIDDVTHVDLGRVAAGPDYNGGMWWGVMEAYNDVTRRVGKEQNVVVVDLARRMPKSSRYFYDFFHFTNEGAQVVAEIVYRGVCQPLQQKFPEYAMAACAGAEGPDRVGNRQRARTGSRPDGVARGDWKHSRISSPVDTGRR